MATVREVILPLEKKKDGTWNLKIRVNHKGKTHYIKTQHFIGLKQIRNDFTIKDPLVLKEVNPILDDYRTKIGELGTKLETYDLPKLVDYLSNKCIKSADEINVIDFAADRIQQLNRDGRKASAANMQTVMNSLRDFFKSAFVSITEIRASMLVNYEKYLTSERKIIRLNQFKRPVETIKKGLSDTGLHNHMRDLRILFNNIKDFYNDEDLDILVVKHYPFKKYKLKDVTENKKPKLTVEQVKQIRDIPAPKKSRIELARDLFMLSFFLCGMNAVDLYQLRSDENLGKRISYNRSKTRSRRRDRAFISVKIPDIAIPLYLKYAGKLQLRYSNHNSLDRALSIGMRKIGEATEIPELEFYDARHAVGDWARNICRFSMDDVALALNHKDQSKSVTDIYVSKNWNIIDEVQEAVISLI